MKNGLLFKAKENPFIDELRTNNNIKYNNKRKKTDEIALENTNNETEFSL